MSLKINIKNITLIWSDYLVIAIAFKNRKLTI
jgi:hypothetical protein